jgi:hypothetical protein
MILATVHIAPDTNTVVATNDGKHPVNVTLTNTGPNDVQLSHNAIGTFENGHFVLGYSPREAISLQLMPGDTINGFVNVNVGGADVKLIQE